VESASQPGCFNSGRRFSFSQTARFFSPVLFSARTKRFPTEPHQHVYNPDDSLDATFGSAVSVFAIQR
jgi:hypothetical protein